MRKWHVKLPILDLYMPTREITPKQRKKGWHPIVLNYLMDGLSQSFTSNIYMLCIVVLFYEFAWLTLLSILTSMIAFLNWIMGQSQDLHFNPRKLSIPSWTNQTRLPCRSMQVLNILISILLGAKFQNNISCQVVLKISYQGNWINFGSKTINSTVLKFSPPFLSLEIIIAGVGEKIGRHYFPFWCSSLTQLYMLLRESTPCSCGICIILSYYRGCFLVTLTKTNIVFQPNRIAILKLQAQANIHSNM